MTTVTTHEYVIEKRGDQWCLLTHDKSKVLGCHDSEAGAQAQEGAIQARQHATDDHKVDVIRDVQIFRTGKWNGDEYTEADLDAMVEAAAQVGFGIPIKNGHTDDRGAPALGWVENLRRIGHTLVADLVALPEKVYNAIRQRSYDRVSAEIYWDLDRNGTLFPRVLKALALLGAEIPAVDLEPLHAFLSFAVMPPMPSSRFASYAVDLSTDFVIDREAMAQICPTCAEAMKHKNIARLKIPRNADGSYAFTEAFKAYQGGFSEALCEKFGESEGFRTRCMESMEQHVGDAGAFCNSLKQWCGRSDMTASQHVKAADTEITMTQQNGEQHGNGDGADGTQVALKDGEIVVRLSEIQELRTMAARAQELPSVRRELERSTQERAALETQQREDRIQVRLMSVRVPALRPYVKVFYDMALRLTEPRTYALTDPKKPMSAEDVVEEFVREINRQAATLFRTLSVDVGRAPMDPNEPDDAAGKVDYRVRKYQRTNPTVDYRQALVAVLDADPDLKEQYRRS